MAQRLLVKNGRVIDPANGIDAEKDVLIEDGRIAAVDSNVEAEGAEVVDAKGRVVAPGFIDMHVHLREPGFEYKETIETGTAAAAAGARTPDPLRRARRLAREGRSEATAGR